MTTKSAIRGVAPLPFFEEVVVTRENNYFVLNMEKKESSTCLL